MEPHGQARDPQKPYPPKASVRHPPVSEIRRSMVDPSLKGFLSRVKHSSTASAVASCVGG
jgi:hypothetical protein